LQRSCSCSAAALHVLCSFIRPAGGWPWLTRGGRWWLHTKLTPAQHKLTGTDPAAPQHLADVNADETYYRSTQFISHTQITTATPRSSRAPPAHCQQCRPSWQLLHAAAAAAAQQQLRSQPRLIMRTRGNNICTSAATACHDLRSAQCLLQHQLSARSASSQHSTPFLPKQRRQKHS
jgi:hypothetical protein